MHLAPGLPSRERIHDLISAIRHGKDAEQIDSCTTEKGVIVVLPMYADSGNIRIRWSAPYVTVVTGASATLSMRAWDRATGEITDERAVPLTGGALHHPVLGQLTIRAQSFSNSTELQGLLGSLVSDGEMALWDLVVELEEPISHFVHNRSKHLAAQMDLDVGGVISSDERNRVRDEIMFGHEGDTSVLTRMIHRAAGDIADGVGDLRQYMVKNLRRDALDAVRRYIGEPRYGSEVRQIAGKRGVEDSEEVLLAIKRANPRMSIGLTVVKAALSASSTLHASTASLEMVREIASTDQELI